MFVEVFSCELQAAERDLQELNIYEPDPKIYTSALAKVRRASLDCYARQVLKQPEVVLCDFDIARYQTSFQ